MYVYVGAEFSEKTHQSGVRKPSAASGNVNKTEKVDKKPKLQHNIIKAQNNHMENTRELLLYNKYCTYLHFVQTLR